MLAKLKFSSVVYLFIFGVYGCGSSTDAPQSDSPSENVVRFVAVGDVGTGSSDQMKVAQAIKQRCALDGCDFALMLGDNFYDSGVSSISDEQFNDKYEVPYGELGIPFYVVLGNHDYGGGGTGIDYVRSLYQLDYVGESNTWNMPHHYYQFTEQHVSFFALDTNAQLFHLDENQRDKIMSWINDSASQWKIVFGHHPYRSNGPHGNAGSYEGISGIPIVSGDGVKDFAEDVWCGKVDLYLSGHDHSRQWLDVDCQGTALVVSGAGAKVTSLPGSNPSLFQMATLGFLYIRIADSKLEAQFINENNDIEFNHELVKSDVM